MNDYSKWIVKDEFKLSIDSWIQYVCINDYSWIIDSSIHEALV